MSNIKTLKVLKHKNTEDLFAFSQGYVPLLQNKEIIMFMNLFAQAKIGFLMKCDEYDYSKFLRNYKLDYEEADEILARLSELNLITVTDKQNLRTIKIEKLKPIHEFMKDDRLHNKLKSEITKEKYEELIHLTGEELETISSKHELNKQTYASFYSGVMDLLGADFTLSSEAIRIIKNSEENIPMETLHKYAYQSTIKVDGKYNISPKHLDFLIKQGTSDQINQFNIDDHIEFWRRIYSCSSEEITSGFEKLFHSHSPFDLYKLLTSKDKAPDALSKWIKNVVQEHHFQFPIINALLSFVMCLLGKIPINYLIKVSDTLKNDYSANKIGVVKWTRSVIENDIRNGKNRLNVSVETVHSPRRNSVKYKESKPEGELNLIDFSCLYSG